MAFSNLEKKLSDENDDESYASCTDEIENAPALSRDTVPALRISTLRSSQPNATQDDEIRCSRAEEMQKKRERMKKFTIDIFVESYEADSNRMR